MGVKVGRRRDEAREGRWLSGYDGLALQAWPQWVAVTRPRGMRNRRGCEEVNALLTSGTSGCPNPSNCHRDWTRVVFQMLSIEMKADAGRIWTALGHSAVVGEAPDGGTSLRARAGIGALRAAA
jgi:hypothetical protein